MKTTEGTERVERTNAVGRDKKTSLTWTRVLAIARHKQEEMAMCRWLEGGEKGGLRHRGVSTAVATAQRW